MTNPLFTNHKPEDADLSNIKGYTGHPGQDRVKPDLNSQHEHSAEGYAQKKKEADMKVGGSEEQSRNTKKQAKNSDKKDVFEDEFEAFEHAEHNEKK